jgi:hypothetical protein
MNLEKQKEKHCKKFPEQFGFVASRLLFCFVVLKPPSFSQLQRKDEENYRQGDRSPLLWRGFSQTSQGQPYLSIEIPHPNPISCLFPLLPCSPSVLVSAPRGRHRHEIIEQSIFPVSAEDLMVDTQLRPSRT